MSAVRGPDDQPSADAIPHGTTRGYRYMGCRCDVCVEGRRARAAAWRAKNKDLIKAQNARTYAKYRERDRELRKALGRADYQRRKAVDPEGLREKNRRSNTSPAGRMRNRLAAHNRRGAKPTPEALEYMPILLADPCAYCGAPGIEIDHVTPVVSGGDGDWTNLTSACRSCNASKKDRSLLAFLARSA